MDILKKIQDHREYEEELKWEGTFAEYLELLRERPYLAQSAHSRVYNMVKSAGVEEAHDHKRYKFFDDDIYGLDEAMEKLVEEYFHPQQEGWMSVNVFSY